MMISDDKIVIISAVRLESDCFTEHCKICLSNQGFAAISCSACPVWGIICHVVLVILYWKN